MAVIKAGKGKRPGAENYKGANADKRMGRFSGAYDPWGSPSPAGSPPQIGQLIQVQLEVTFMKVLLLSLETPEGKLVPRIKHSHHHAHHQTLDMPSLAF